MEPSCRSKNEGTRSQAASRTHPRKVGEPHPGHSQAREGRTKPTKTTRTEPRSNTPLENGRHAKKEEDSKHVPSPRWIAPDGREGETRKASEARAARGRKRAPSNATLECGGPPPLPWLTLLAPRTHRNRRSAGDEDLFVCERVCTSDRLLRRMGGLAKVRPERLRDGFHRSDPAIERESKAAGPRR